MTFHSFENHERAGRQIELNGDKSSLAFILSLSLIRCSENSFGEHLYTALI